MTSLKIPDYDLNILRKLSQVELQEFTDSVSRANKDLAYTPKDILTEPEFDREFSNGLKISAALTVLIKAYESAERHSIELQNLSRNVTEQVGGDVEADAKNLEDKLNITKRLFRTTTLVTHEMVKSYNKVGQIEIEPVIRPVFVDGKIEGSVIVFDMSIELLDENTEAMHFTLDHFDAELLFYSIREALEKKQTVSSELSKSNFKVFEYKGESEYYDDL